MHNSDDREWLTRRVLTELERRTCEQDAITMTELFARVTGETVIPWRRYDQTRVIRSIVKQLREDGHPIANGTGGYYMAASAEALQPTIERYHQRAMSSLKTEAALKKIDPAGLVEQYRLELQATEENTDE